MNNNNITIKLLIFVVQCDEYPKLIHWERLPIQSIYIMCRDKKLKKKNILFLIRKQLKFTINFLKYEKINSRRICRKSNGKA